MKNILFDLRGQGLNVLITDGKTVQYRKSCERFSLQDKALAGKVLADIGSESGVKLDKAHLILPAEDVAVSIQRTPLMSGADAEKVIRRRMVKETGDASPILGVYPAVSGGGDRQAFIVETVKRDPLSSLVGFFGDLGIRIQTASTALPSNLKALHQIQGEALHAIALLEITKDYIELTALMGAQVLFYHKMSIPPVDREKELEEGKTPERIAKLQVYRTAELVYTAHAAYQHDHPDTPLAKLWIAGSGSTLSGISDVVKESTGFDVSQLNTFGESVEDGYLYTALHGLALGLLDGTAVNYLPRDLSWQLPLGKTARMATAGAIGLVLIVTAFAMETQYGRTKALLETRLRESTAREQPGKGTDPYLRNRQYLTRLMSSQTAWYPMLGYLAEKTPDGVYIGGLTFQVRQEIPSLEIDFVTPYPSQVGTNKLLTRIIAMIDGFSGLRRRGEPSISIIGQGGDKLLHFKVACEVTPL
ncbi:MAG: hypothetical protein AABZ15_07610 [Nitrospirota bacterium]